MRGFGLLPSRTRYTIPVASATVMEAIAAATPIVGSSRLSRDVLLDGVNGLVVDTAPSVMAAALKAVLDDDALWGRLSVGAGRIVRRFDAYRVAQQYLSLVPEGVRGARIDLGDYGSLPRYLVESEERSSLVITGI